MLVRGLLIGMMTLFTGCAGQFPEGPGSEAMCATSTEDCQGQTSCTPGDEACFSDWVDARCSGTISATVIGGNKVFKCTEGEPICKNFSCQVVPMVCEGTEESCGQTSGCKPGDEPCFKDWVDTRCAGLITQSTSASGNKVFTCTEGSGELACKTTTCEVIPEACTWTEQSCGLSSGCTPGDEACYKNWVATRCTGVITETTSADGNKVFTCSNGEPVCKTTTCEVLDAFCKWTAEDCGDYCEPGNDVCFRGWMEERCTSAITESTSASGHKVYECRDAAPICKIFTCESY